MVICFLGIGANLGDRRRNIELALQKINQLKKTKVIKVSKIIETKPVGGPANQRRFLNAVLKARTGLTPLVLLAKLKHIEKELGRKKAVRNGPRTIDLDILFYGNRVIKGKRLQIPHPKIFERQFVIKPLLEII